ncbi:Diguanylate cyclase (GGDEF) domain-containing protein [Alteromonas macleodii]|uniref:diguanylate cyclase n=1 Tax=Alteromonas macleodii TaxID=28108 RepID=A0A6T9Y2T6_ALTMA|nr:Diguanylate cyclase (GGDEF) domain-containing protein [Alteromonas macleodii]
MINTLSLPLFVTSSICLLMSFFFALLYYRLTFHHQEPVKYYFLFALSAFISSIFFGAFGVLINAGENLFALSVSNRLTIIGAMFTLVTSLHFYLAFYSYTAPYFLKWCYVICGIFSVLTAVPSPYFLDNAFYATSKYYTGLKYGLLFEIWGLWILVLGSYCVYILIRVFVRQRSRLEGSGPILLLLLANTLWLITGIGDTLTGIEIIDLPPLTWLGSFVVTSTIAWVLVLHIDGLYKERRTLNNQLMYDHLTQALSRSFMEVKLNEAIFQIQSSAKNRLAVCIFDVDNFKNINDSYGHSSGDVLLKNITEIVKRHLSSSDCVARLGGDEFVILFSDYHSALKASDIVEQIRQTIAFTVFKAKAHTFNTTCSFGIVNILSKEDLAEDPAHDILSIADEALYTAKSLGKNTIKSIGYHD